MPAQPAWSTPRSVALLIAAYLLVHLGVRLWGGSALGVDDAEQALFAQHWLATYRTRAPPLFTWAVMALSPVTGAGVVTISLLRYLLLGMVLGFTYLTARRLIRDPSLAVVATASVTAIYVFGYYSHHDLTHTTTLSAFLAASWYVFVRLCETPTLRWYLALGVCFGLGTLGKWNFAIFAVALPLACLVLPAYRRLVLDWRIVPAGAVAAAIVLPSALAALQLGAVVGDDIEGMLGNRNGSLLYVVAKGTASLAVAVLAYPQPFLIIFLIAFGAIAWRGLRAPASLSAPAAATGVEPMPSAALLATVMAIAIGLHWLLVPLARATAFQERLLQPALMILPIYLFMLVERGLGGSIPARKVRNYGLALVALAVAVLGTRIGIHVAGADHCRGACRDLLPAADIAAGLRAAGFKGTGTVLVRDMHLGGNLRAQLPQAHIMATGYPRRVWPRSDGSGQCMLVWSDYGIRAERQRAEIGAYLAQDLGASGAAKGREGAVTVPYARSRRTYRIFYELYDAPQGDCR